MFIGEEDGLANGTDFNPDRCQPYINYVYMMGVKNCSVGGSHGLDNIVKREQVLTSLDASSAPRQSYVVNEQKFTRTLVDLV